MKPLPLEQKVAGVLPYPGEGRAGHRAGLRRDPRSRIEAVILALGDRLKVFSDILKLGRYFFTERSPTTPTPSRNGSEEGRRARHARRTRRAARLGRAV